MERLLHICGLKIERFAERKHLVDWTCALFAGVVVSAFSCWISTMTDPLDISHCVKLTVKAILSYAAAALLVGIFRRGILRRMLPSWLMIGFFGSTLNVSIIAVVKLPSAWADPYTKGMYATFTAFFLDEIEMYRSVVLIHCMLTLPVLAVIYYSGTIVRVLRKWHSPESTISILRG